MTKDIWDEKPHYIWVPRGYSSKVRIKDDDIQMLNLEEMDAWLEKLKAEYDRLQKEGLEHHAIAVEYYEKLEAIKSWYEVQVSACSDVEDLPRSGKLFRLALLVSNLEGFGEILEASDIQFRNPEWVLLGPWSRQKIEKTEEAEV